MEYNVLIKKVLKKALKVFIEAMANNDMEIDSVSASMEFEGKVYKLTFELQK